MIHAIKIGGFVLADANRPGQGIIATVSIGNDKLFAILLNIIKDKLANFLGTAKYILKVTVLKYFLSFLFVMDLKIIIFCTNVVGTYIH